MGAGWEGCAGRRSLGVRPVVLSKGLGPVVWGEAEGAFGDAVSWGSGRRLLPGHVCGVQSWDESGREGSWGVVAAS